MKNDLINNYSEEKYGAMRTAFLTAYPKIFTNIDYAVDIFKEMKQLAINKCFSFSPNQFSNEMSVEIEARFKALNNVLSQHINKDTLVVEIAAGLSPRHLQFQKYDYIELDLPPVIDIKKDIYNSMNYPNFSNTVYGADVTDSKVLTKILSNTLKQKQYKKVIVLIEGLFWYISKSQIESMTNTFKKCFKNVDWIWITSDCPPTKKVDAEYRSIISNSAKIKKEKTFADYEDFASFFNSLGLVHSRHTLSDFIKYNELSSAQFFSVSETNTIERLTNYTDIAILKIK